MRNFTIILVLAVASLFPAAPLLAAPFCVQTQAMPPECAYFDAAQCRKRANELSGYCVANPGEFVISAGGTGSYCLVLSSRQAQCVYADRTSCESDAGPANGVCIEKPVSNIPEDPYRLDINRTY